MKNQDEKKVILPNGKMCSDCCSDCMYMNLEDTTRYGDAYCVMKREYRSPYETARYCSDFKSK